MAWWETIRSTPLDMDDKEEEDEEMDVAPSKGYSNDYDKNINNPMHDILV